MRRPRISWRTLSPARGTERRANRAAHLRVPAPSRIIRARSGTGSLRCIKQKACSSARKVCTFRTRTIPQEGGSWVHVQGRIRGWVRGEVAERSKALDWNSSNIFTGVRGFESHPLRQLCPVLSRTTDRP